MTSDDVIVISHDKNTKRCFGIDFRIQETPYAGVIDKLLIPKEGRKKKHSHFSNVNQNLTEKELYQLPTFESIAEKFASDPLYESVLLMIDIKLYNSASIVPKLVDVLKKVNSDLEGFWAKKIILGIWRLDVLEAAKQFAPMFDVIHIGVSRRLAKEFMDRAYIEKDPKETKNETSSAGLNDETAPLISNDNNESRIQQVKGVSLFRYTLMSLGGLKFIEEAKKRNMSVYMWTVNDIPAMKWCMASDLDGIITDYPDVYAALRLSYEPKDEDESAKQESQAVSKIESPNNYVSWADYYIFNFIKYLLIRLIFRYFMYSTLGLKTTRSSFL